MPKDKCDDCLLDWGCIGCNKEKQTTFSEVMKETIKEKYENEYIHKS